MSQKNPIGLDPKQAQQLAEKLNVLLANYQLFYINTRGFHWNIKGDKFFELHLKFEELYNNALLKVDEIAERILTLDYTPLHTFTDYVRESQIKEITNESDGTACVQHVVRGFGVLLELEREVLRMAGEADDEGTNALMSDYIREQEKLVWMYSSFLKA
ncbi:MAG: DNA starvation/stationary phase protection protein [Flavipsychrobacter sp.]|nr:DNA starvation/stationary phase protection protein [Flavipsychrobacter sp.]